MADTSRLTLAERLEARVWLLAKVCVSLSAAALLTTAALLVFPGLRSSSGLVREGLAYRVGDQVDLPRESYAGSAHTVLLFVRASCAACQQAKPLLVELVQRSMRVRGVRVRVLAPATNRENHLEYIRTLGLSEGDLLANPVTDTKARVVPTVLLVDGNGTIIRASEGSGQQLQNLVNEALEGILPL